MPAGHCSSPHHDPTGWDILRDFVARTGCWVEVIRVALDPELIAAYDLPESIDPEIFKKLERDSRANAFIQRFGSLAQVELDALDPDVLRGLFADAIAPFWDTPPLRRSA